MSATLRPQWIVGKKVARVEQCKRMLREYSGGTETEVERIHFDDGSYVYFVALESDFEPFVKALYVKPPKAKGGAK